MRTLLLLNSITTNSNYNKLMNKKIDLTATLALIGSVICWATVPLFLKYFTHYIDSWTANGIRYPMAALVYLPMLLFWIKGGRLTKKMWKLALLPASINIIGQVFWAWTPYFIDPGVIAFLVRLSTVLTVAGSFIFFKDERAIGHSKEFWLGLALAIFGFIAMTVGGNTQLGRGTTIGIIMVLFTSIFWAGYQLSVRHTMQNIDSRIAFGMISQITAAGMIVFMFTFGEPAKAMEMPSLVTVLVIISGLIGIAAAHVLFYVAIKRIGVAIASSVNLSSAFITAIISRFIFQEKLTLIQWTAGAILVVGGLLITRAQVYLKK